MKGEYMRGTIGCHVLKVLLATAASKSVYWEMSYFEAISPKLCP